MHLRLQYICDIQYCSNNLFFHNWSSKCMYVAFLTSKQHERKCRKTAGQGDLWWKTTLPSNGSNSGIYVGHTTSAQEGYLHACTRLCQALQSRMMSSRKPWTHADTQCFSLTISICMACYIQIEIFPPFFTSSNSVTGLMLAFSKQRAMTGGRQVIFTDHE